MTSNIESKSKKLRKSQKFVMEWKKVFWWLPNNNNNNNNNNSNNNNSNNNNNMKVLFTLVECNQKQIFMKTWLINFTR